jgi:predicted amidophosphoribosyltransferase
VRVHRCVTIAFRHHSEDNVTIGAAKDVTLTALRCGECQADFYIDRAEPEFCPACGSEFNSIAEFGSPLQRQHKKGKCYA